MPDNVRESSSAHRQLCIAVVVWGVMVGGTCDRLLQATPTSAVTALKFYRETYASFPPPPPPYWQ